MVAPEHAFVTAEALASRLDGTPRFEELMIGDDAPPKHAPAGADVRHVRCVPTLEFHGRVHDWIIEIRQARERGDTVLFVADSAGRAERTLEILKEYDVVALPAELAEDAH